MSKFKINKTVLATALAVAMVPGTAFAAKIVLGAHTKHAFEATNKDPLTADLNSTFSYDLEGGDILVGRNAGNVNVRITLTGADFASTPTVSVPSTQGTPASPAVTFTGNVASFVITPSSSGMTTGPLFTVSAPTLKTTKANASSTLITLGGKVESSVDVRDATSGTQLQTAVNGSILVSTQASKVTLADSVESTATVASGKKSFATVTATTPDTRTIKLAGITTNAQAGTGATGLVSAAGYGTADNIDGALDFQFDASGTASLTQSARDRLGVQVNFADTAGFTHVFLEKGSTCPTVTTISPPVSVADTRTVLTKTGNQYAGEIDLSNASSESFSVCGRTDGDTVLAKQDITTAARYNFLVARDTDFPGAVKTASIKFDGASQDVDFFNPSSNTNQQSFLRITNASGTNGTVTITGRCDDGTQVTAGVLTLNSQRSVLLTAQALAAGTGMTTALGTCSAGGKLRLNVTGEFSPMKVQNFVKSVIASGEITTNVNSNDKDKQ